MKNKIFVYMILILMLLFNFFIVFSNADETCIDSSNFYFNNYDTGVAWSKYPANMIDGNINTFASSKEGEVQLNDGNNATGTEYYGEILYVYCRMYGFESSDLGDMLFTPVTTGGIGDIHTWNTFSTTHAWSPWFDITNDTNMGLWTWLNFASLNCYVEYDSLIAGDRDYAFISLIQIKVVYAWSQYDPEINNITPDMDVCYNNFTYFNFTANDEDSNYYPFVDNQLFYNMSVYYAKNDTLVFNYNGLCNDSDIVSHDYSSYLVNNTMYKLYINLTDNCGYTENTTYFSTLCYCDCPDINESMRDNDYTNFTLNNESWVNISWESWFNDTDGIDTLETQLSIIDQYINNTVGVSCFGVVWVNYTDNNITFNVSVDKSDDSNTSIYKINEDNYLYISGFELNPQMLILLLIGIWYYFGTRDKDAIFFLFSSLTSMVGGIYFVGVDGMNILSINFWTGLILLFSSIYFIYLMLFNIVNYGFRKK